MNLQDKELIDEKFKGVYTLLKTEFDGMNETLVLILEQAKKTNGRVSVLEEKDHKRDIFCSNVQTEKKTKDEGRDKMNTGLKWLVIFLVMVIALLWGNNLLGNKDSLKYAPKQTVIHDSIHYNK